MILIGENRCTGRQTCPSATLCTTNITWIGLEWKPVLRGDSHQVNVSRYLSFKFIPDSKHRLAVWAEYTAVQSNECLTRDSDGTCTQHLQCIAGRNVKYTTP